MFHIRRKRTLIRLVSFFSTAFVIAIAFGATSTWKAYTYRMSIEYSYQRALSELTVHVNNIDLELQKGIYAGTPTQLVGLTSQLWQDAGAAKTNLSQIPVDNNNMRNTYKFISQVGDYANSLSKNVAFDQEITAADRKNMSMLSGFAKKLSSQLAALMDDLQSGKLSVFTANYAMKNNLSNNEKSSGQPSVDNGFSDMENVFTSVPSLIYDGPFSDNILKKSADLTKNKKSISKDDARAIAAGFIGVPAGKVAFSGDTGGNLPTYNYTSGTSYVSISKAGGYEVRMMNSREIKDEKLTAAEALKKARLFLDKNDIGSMRESYYQINNNICVINYCYMQGDVAVYTDLIKVGVALDTGSIISFDATGFIMNHKDRKLAQPVKTAAELKKLISPNLKFEKVSLVIIPGGDLSELMCYEFKCEGENGQDVLDYFNAKTGKEEQILILLQTPGGVLAI